MPVTSQGVLGLTVACTLLDSLAWDLLSGRLQVKDSLPPRKFNQWVVENTPFSFDDYLHLVCGDRVPKYAEVDLLMGEPFMAEPAVSLASECFFRQTVTLSTAKLRRSDLPSAHVSFHAHSMRDLDPPRRKLTSEARDRVGQQVLVGLAQLVTDNAWVDLPEDGNWRHPERVSWEAISRFVGAGIPSRSSRHGHRDMVRDVMPRDGAQLTNGEIYERIQKRFGSGAPSRRAINLAIGGLRRAGELEGVRYGLQWATATLGAPPKSTDPTRRLADASPSRSLFVGLDDDLPQFRERAASLVLSEVRRREAKKGGVS